MSSRTIKCDVHDEVEWDRDWVCTNCKQIHLAERIVKEDGSVMWNYKLVSKGLCVCGKRLLGGSDFTGRPVCRACAMRVLQAS